MSLKLSDFVHMGQGPATKVDDNSLEHQKDNSGFTKPNLHRRVDTKSSPLNNEEVGAREYQIGIYGLNSYRTTKINYHDEESVSSETP